jgi:putative effector of murein hydrolase LrgA (UPF0299 family)
MTAMNVVGMIALALLLALAAGAASGVRIGADALGKELAALMGAFFGPTAALPAVLVGLAVLHFMR